MTHTPGPWEVRKWGREGDEWPYARWSIGQVNGGAVVISPRYPYSNFEADARLIAAAPDLLVALKEALTLVDEAQTGVSVQWTMRWQEKSRAAIAKAEGQTLVATNQVIVPNRAIEIRVRPRWMTLPMWWVLRGGEERHLPWPLSRVYVRVAVLDARTQRWEER